MSVVTVFRHTYDALRRPLENWVLQPARDLEGGELKNDASGQVILEDCCYERFSYGEKAPNATTGNFRGRIWRHRDTAGIVKMLGYDAKGNLLSLPPILLLLQGYTELESRSFAGSSSGRGGRRRAVRDIHSLRRLKPSDHYPRTGWPRWSSGQ